MTARIERITNMAGHLNVAPAATFHADGTEQFNARVKSMLPPRVRKLIAEWSSIGNQHSDANDAAADAHWALQERLRAQISEASGQLAAYQRDDARGLMAPSGRNRNDASGPITVTEAGNPLMEAKREELAELRERLDQLRKRGAAVPDLPPTPKSPLHPWLLGQPSDARFVDHIAPVKLVKQTAVEALESCRAKIIAMLAEVRAVEIAPLTVEDAIAQATRDINALAVGGTPDFSLTLRRVPDIVGRRSQGKTKWPKNYVNEPHDREKELGDGLAFAVWLHKDAVLERATAEIRKIARPNAIPLGERDARKAALTAEIFAMERVEAALLDLAHLENAKVEWRHSASVEALLQVRRAE